MAGRIRTIKPELIEDATVAELSHPAFRLFIAMLLLADDHGNLRAHPKQLDAAVFWLVGCDERALVVAEQLALGHITEEHARDYLARHSRDTRETLAELSRAGLVVRYAVRGQPYASIASWKKHQRVDKPSAPRVPGPDDPQALDISTLTEDPRRAPRDPRETLATVSRDTRENLAPDHDPDPDHDPELNTLSGKPDVSPDELKSKRGEKARQARAVSEAVIGKLNRDAGSCFEPDATGTLKLITRLLAEGYTERDMRMVVWDRVGRWGADPMMGEYLRPKTLFALANFENYVAEARKAWGPEEPGGEIRPC